MGKRKQLDMEGEPLNLIPIMNLLTILIPFLTLSAVFLKIAVLPTTLPAVSSGASASKPPEEQKEPEKPPLNLTVSIIRDGFVVAGAGGVLGNEANDGGPTIPNKTNGEYDYEGLTKKLVEIKKQFPHEKDCILIPEMDLKGDGSKVDIPYQVVVDAMDAIREAPENVVDSDEDGKVDKILFPGVIFSPGIL